MKKKIKPNLNRYNDFHLKEAPTTFLQNQLRYWQANPKANEDKIKEVEAILKRRFNAAKQPTKQSSRAYTRLRS